MSAAGLAVAVVLPVSAVTAISPASAASAPTSAVATAVVPPTAAQVAAAKALAAKQKAAARKAAKKRAAARKHAKAVARGKKIVKVAAKYKGRPYRWAAAGPRAFDCSGYTLYVVRKALGVKLPHYTVAQKKDKDVKRVKKSDRHVGDLIFYHRGGTIAHVGIYAGNGKMWDSPRTGYNVGKRKIHRGKVTYGRVA